MKIDDIPIDDAIRSLSTERGNRALGKGGLDKTFGDGLMLSMLAQLMAGLHMAFQGGVALAVCWSLFSGLDYVFGDVTAAVLAVLAGVAGGTWAMFKFGRDNSAMPTLQPGVREPSNNVVAAMFQVMCRVRPLTADDATVSFEWKNRDGPGGVLEASTKTRDGTRLEFVIDDRHTQLKVDAKARGRGERRATTQSAKIDRHGKLWEDGQGQLLKDVGAPVGHFVGNFLAQNLAQDGGGIVLTRGRPDHGEPVERAVPIESPLITPEIEPVSVLPRKERRIPFLTGILIGSAPWLAVVVWLFWFGLGAISSDPHAVFASGVSMMFGWFMACLLGLHGRELLKAPAKRMRKVRRSRKSTGRVAIEGGRVEIDGRWIDLRHPFAVRLFRSRSNQGQECVVVELAPRGASASSRRARFGVRLGNHGDQNSLDRLDVEVELLDEAFFIEHLWPTLTAWSSAHGQNLDVDFALGMRLPEPVKEGSEVRVGAQAVSRHE